MTKGFSLIELATVIVIISLILAGVASGINLVKQSEIRATIADFQAYKKAYRDFTVRYKQVPGDMVNAANFWSSGCAVTITCNGDGDARIEALWNNSLDETARAWKHLNLAELIPDGIAVIPAAYLGTITIGVLAPAGKINGTGYYIASGSDIGRSTTGGTVMASPWSDALVNSVFLGRASSLTVSNGLTYGSMNALTTYNIDKKIDDGVTDVSGNATGFASGKFRARNDSTLSTNCVNAGATSYVTSSTSEVCIVGYQLNDR